MPSYKRPGVVIEESLTPLTQTFSAPGEAAAAFVGAAMQGPTTPTVVASWQQYLRLFGGFGTGVNLLPFAVFQYFNNGGRSAYVVRAASADAVAATLTLTDRAATPGSSLRFTASSVGVWGDGLYVDIIDSSTPGRFDLQVRYGGTTDDKVVERFLDVTTNPSDPRYVVGIVNAPNSGSIYVDVVNTAAVSVWSVDNTPAAGLATPLTGGADGSATPDLVGATKTLAEVDENLNVNLPGVSSNDVINPLITWAESTGRVFLVVDVAQRVPADSPATTAGKYAALGSGAGALTASSYAAVYGPWLLVDDPASSVAGSVRALPPGGAVLGVYALTDVSRGVQKPPAGTAARLSGVLGVETRFLDADLETLFAGNVNVIRQLPGYGYCVMGARTLKTGMPDRYISIRRTLMYIKKALVDGTRWVVFEPNNATLWESIEASLSQFLTSLMQIDVLKGDTPDQAFYVKCDEENNTPTTVAAGEVHVEVGVALNSPAEFVVINIGQYDGSSTATDTTTA